MWPREPLRGFVDLRPGREDRVRAAGEGDSKLSYSLAGGALGRRACTPSVRVDWG